jgi:outer membrane receptor for ferrienterochelin and colicins
MSTKYISVALVAVLLLSFGKVMAQSSKDSTAVIFVAGACEMCKERIEKAAMERKGVKSAVWDVNTQKLSLVYNPAVITVEKIQCRIADRGHDNDFELAKDAVYKTLPACCNYREINAAKVPDNAGIPGDSLFVPQIIKGVVLEESKQGSFMPLAGASVVWAGTNNGTVSDTSGVFSITQIKGVNRLVISYTGYSPDTISTLNAKELKIILASGKQLNEVTVTSKQRSTYLSSLNPIRTQVMTERELFKAACCNLSESFETNPSVDVSYNDAVTGSKQIQLLGLSGNYTQLTVESLPGPRGLATPFGLNFIPGPFVESIQLNKGVGSVVNGYESIAGQINVELKKPQTAEKLYLNAYINDMTKTDLNLVLTEKFGDKWSTALLLHDNFQTKTNVDYNKDGFRDMTSGNLFTAVNRWNYNGTRGFESQLGFKILIDNLTGGQTNFDPDKDKFTTRSYGLGITTNRYEVYAKAGYVFPEKKYKSIGLQLSAFDHKQDSYFGMTAYYGRQKNFYVNLIYQSIIGTTAHKFRTGLSFLSDNYNELFNTTRYKRQETVPGAFFEYTFTPVEKFNIVAGMRADHNSLFARPDGSGGRGWFATPRLHVRYEPVKGTTIRLSAGRGQRTANIFAENNSVFVSARQMNIITSSAGKAYGLDPEVAWNKGISIDQKFRLFKRSANFALDFFRNDFQQQVIVDLEDARQVKFYNLDGKSYSNSFQAEMNLEPVQKLEVRLAYRFFDVRSTYGGQLLQKPFTARHRAFTNLAYETGGWKFDYTFNINGSKRITNTSANPPVYQKRLESPSYILMNAQVSKTVGKKHPVDLYIGGENLTNFLQGDVIVSADQPFGPYFDASLIWGPVTGRMFYAGFRYKIK